MGLEKTSLQINLKFREHSFEVMADLKFDKPRKRIS